MDGPNLIAAISACLNPDTEIRKAGEEAVKQQPYHPGGLASLLSIAMEPSADLAVRQVAAIAVKNAIRKGWSLKGQQQSHFSDSDRTSVRDRLLEGLCHSPPAIRVQLEESARNVVTSDYAQNWPSLIPSLQSFLVSQDVQMVAGSLRMLRIIARNYEYSDRDDREPMNTTVRVIFPSLLQVFQGLLQNKDSSIELAEMLKLCCKIFWSTIYIEVPSFILEDEQFNGWMGGLLSLANRPVPRDSMPEDNEERQKWPWWKVKKWVYHIFCRIFRRYGDPKKCGCPEDVAFASRWKEQCSEPFLIAALSELSAVAHGQYVSSRVCNNLMTFISEAIKYGHTWKILKSHIQEIVGHAVLPLLAFNEEDEELWNEDPQEYVRKGYDVLEDIYSSKTAAMNLLDELCKVRKKSQLDLIMGQIVAILNNAQSAAQDNSMPPEVARKLDGAMLAIGSLESVLQREARYKEQLGPMLMGHVVPLFTSRYGHLRAKAVWLAGRFCDTEFVDGKGKGNTFSTLLQGVVAALEDPELPVRVDAAVSVGGFLHALEDEDLGILRPLVPELLKRLLDLSRDSGTEDITSSLQILVERFGPELAPYASSIMTALVHQFWHAVQESSTSANDLDDNDQVEFDDSGALAGYSLLSAMETVLDAISSVGELYPQMEELLFPILERFTSSDGLDVFEEITALITYLTFLAPEITPRMWTLYPRILSCLNDWASDYWEDCLPPIDNFISRGTEFFLNCKDPNLIMLTNQTLERALSIKAPELRSSETGDGNNESVFSFTAVEAATCAAKVVSVILQNCRGKIDEYIGPYIALIASRLLAEDANKCGGKETDAMLVAICDAFYYNPSLVARTTSEMGALDALMKFLVGAILANKKSGKMRHFKSLRAKKVAVLGMTSILSVPLNLLPQSLVDSLGDITVATLRILTAYKEQEEKAVHPYLSGEEGDSGSDDGLRLADTGKYDEWGSGDEDGDVDDEELYRRARAAARAASRYEEDDDDELDFDSDDDWWTDEDEVDIKTPLDDISPYIYFAETLQNIQMSDPSKFASVTSKMDQGAQQAAHGMMEFAANLRKEDRAS